MLNAFRLLTLIATITGFSQLNAMEPNNELNECPVCLQEFNDDLVGYEKLVPSCNNKHVICSWCFKYIMGSGGQTCPTCRHKIDREEFECVLEQHNVRFTPKEKTFFKEAYGRQKYDGATGNSMFDIPIEICEEYGIGFWHIAPPLTLTAFYLSDFNIMVAGGSMVYMYCTKHLFSPPEFPQREERRVERKKKD